MLNAHAAFSDVFKHIRRPHVVKAQELVKPVALGGFIERFQIRDRFLSGVIRVLEHGVVVELVHLGDPFGEGAKHHREFLKLSGRHFVDHESARVPVDDILRGVDHVTERILKVFRDIVISGVKSARVYVVPDRFTHLPQSVQVLPVCFRGVQTAAVQCLLGHQIDGFQEVCDGFLQFCRNVLLHVLVAGVHEPAPQALHLMAYHIAVFPLCGAFVPPFPPLTECFVCPLFVRLFNDAACFPQNGFQNILVLQHEYGIFQALDLDVQHVHLVQHTRGFFPVSALCELLVPVLPAQLRPLVYCGVQPVKSLLEDIQRIALRVSQHDFRVVLVACLGFQLVCGPPQHFTIAEARFTHGILRDIVVALRNSCHGVVLKDLVEKRLAFGIVRDEVTVGVVDPFHHHIRVLLLDCECVIGLVVFKTPFAADSAAVQLRPLVRKVEHASGFQRLVHHGFCGISLFRAVDIEITENAVNLIGRNDSAEIRLPIIGNQSLDFGASICRETTPNGEQ